MPRWPRLIVAASTAVLASFALTACTGIGQASVSPGSSQEGSALYLQTVYDAVSAADPRIEDPLGSVSTSGFAKTFDLSVLITGDEPVTTETLTAIFVAIRDTTPRSIETVTVVARDADDVEKIVDLSAAIAGLPDDLTPLYDGGVTLMRVDLDKL